MAVTIKDVARIAGVSPSTVSRVINGKGVISEETKNKIYKVMEELNYYPNSLARSFASGNTFTIGLVIDAKDESTFSNAFFNRSVFAIETVTHNNDYNLLIVNDREDKNSKSSIERLVLEKKVDGLILPPSTMNQKLVKRLLELDFPFVVLGEPKSYKMESSWVDINNKQGSEMAIKHFVEKGYKKIAYIFDERGNVFEQNRLEGYKSGLLKAGLEIKDAYIIECLRDSEQYYKEAVKALDSSEPPDAFLCSNNIIAFYVLKAIKSKKLIVPNHVGVISFDNYPIAEYTDPPLSVVDIDTYALGEQVANILLQKIEKNNSTNQQTLISTNLILRESTMR